MTTQPRGGTLWEREPGWKGGFLKAGLGFRNGCTIENS